MAASCLGQFGSHKLAWSRQRQELAEYYPPTPSGSTDTVWITQRYVPTDLRVLAPVPRHKLIAPSVESLPVPERHWLRPAEKLSPYTFSREHEEQPVRDQKQYFASQPSTRCEEWSTLRQMLPSRGSHRPGKPANWGSGFGDPPTRSADVKKSFSHFNSPMTRYVDQMHATNRLFKLY